MGLSPHLIGSFTIAAARSGYHARPQPSAFSSPRAPKARIERSAARGRSNERPINSHIERGDPPAGDCISRRPRSRGSATVDRVLQPRSLTRAGRMVTARAGDTLVRSAFAPRFFDNSTRSAWDAPNRATEDKLAQPMCSRSRRRPLPNEPEKRPCHQVQRDQPKPIAGVADRRAEPFAKVCERMCSKSRAEWANSGKRGAYGGD